MKIKLKCNACESNIGSIDIHKVSDDVACPSCNHTYKSINGKLITSLDILDSKNSTWESVNTEFNPFRNSFNQKFNHPNVINGPKLSELRSKYNLNSQESVCINLGSGQDKIEGFVNVDYGQYESVHLAADITQLPLQNESVDLVISNSVLEHVKKPEQVVKEVYRVLRPGGVAYICVPQVSVRHHEIDYFRWTMPGLKRLFNGFSIEGEDYVRSPAYSVFSIIKIVELSNSFSHIQRFKLKLAQLCLDFLWKFDFEKNEYNLAASNTIYIELKK